MNEYCIIYICPICLNERIITGEIPAGLFPKCHGHYMIEKEDWEADKKGYLIARDYELAKIVEED